ncbi:sporulation protein Cse60 [Aneurinibacillus sp. Ricciae_BoGa-3]|uniref:sporulation protein Cse60 n=1 Tax=Aneurinibacillus sp. Ricciae_BoGa-3 TaxID=3022697 RepID=UPI0023404E44|nr:sporulation protein Cse60 [Aneurinibacillus sp. Ricciae_BoGa-3]WCK52808.1 sporulation protein Cse60 [Aneurinibacillus sp. Ricciae_BoGa-3]
MLQVKIFNHTQPEKLEKEINQFLKRLPEEDFVDIKLSSTGDPENVESGNVFDMVLLVYRTED